MFTIADWIVFGVLAIASLSIGATLGFLYGIKNDYALRINKKIDYELKIKELEGLMEQVQKNLDIEEPIKYKGAEFFAPGTTPEFGLPKTLK